MRALVVLSACVAFIGVGLAPAAHAGDFFVRCQVEGAADGDGSKSQDHIFDSGQIEATSTQCGPTVSGAGGTIESSGPNPGDPVKTYTQSSDGAGGALAGTGILHGGASASALVSGDMPTPYSAEGTGVANASFHDRLTIAGLPPFTLVTVKAIIFLHSSASIEGSHACTSASADYARGNVSITLPGGSETLDNDACTTPSPSREHVQEFTVLAGVPFGISGAMSLGARASADNDQPHATASINAGNTAGVYLNVEAPGASLASASGHDYSPPATDSTAPETSASLAPEPNDAGWSRSDTTVTLTASDEDGGSGVKDIVYRATGAQPIDPTTEEGSKVSIPISRDGDTTLTYWAEDRAGNKEAEKTVTVKLDKTEPHISCDSPDGDWHAADVGLSCRATDEGGSGLAHAGDASFALHTSVPADTETPDAHTDAHEVCDVAGSCATASPIPGNKVDKKPPVVAITRPIDGVSFTLGQPVAADYACQDGGSGLASCVGTVAKDANLDTGSVGHKAFRVDVKDRVGNAGAASSRYDVVYDFSGFFAPVNNPPTVNVANAGRSIPVKFSLSGNRGLEVLAAAPTSIAVPCDGSEPADPVETTTSSPAGLTYDPTSDQYSYVWKTAKAWVNSCRELIVRLNDGSAHRAIFQLR